MAQITADRPPNGCVRVRLRFSVSNQRQGQLSAISDRSQRAATVRSGSDQVCDGDMATFGCSPLPVQTMSSRQSKHWGTFDEVRAVTWRLHNPC